MRLKVKHKKFAALQSKRAIAVLVVGSVCIVGIYLLIASHALTPTAAIEPENGTLASGATQVTDAAASGGKAVQFPAAGTTPPACANGGSFLWSNLETCGWPGPTNTGYDLSQ